MSVLPHLSLPLRANSRAGPGATVSFVVNGISRTVADERRFMNDFPESENEAIDRSRVDADEGVCRAMTSSGQPVVQPPSVGATFDACIRHSFAPRSTAHWKRVPVCRRLPYVQRDRAIGQGAV